MDDLIKRQDAIDACLNGFCACVSDCVDEIEKLPSAQLFAKDMNVPSNGDLISREEVLKYKCDCYDSEGHLLYAVPTGYIVRMPSAQKTAKRIVGCGRNGMTMWYQCDMCNEPVDEKDTFCRGCGRRFEDG